MKKLILILFLFGCNTENDLINEIKTSNSDILRMSIEEGMNKIAGIGGHVNWLIVEEKGLTDNNLVVLEADIKTFDKYSEKNIECVYRFVYNKNTKQNKLWYAEVGGRIMINEGKYISKNHNEYSDEAQGKIIKSEQRKDSPSANESINDDTINTNEGE